MSVGPSQGAQLNIKLFLYLKEKRLLNILLIENMSCQILLDNIAYYNKDNLGRRKIRGASISFFA